MKNNGIRGRVITTGLAALLLSGLCMSAQAAEQAGNITELEGQARITRADGTQAAAQLNSMIYVGDLIRTSADCRMTILFLDESVMTLSPDTEMKIDELVYKPEESFRSSVFSLVTGTVKGIVGGWFSDDEELSRFEVRTPTAVAGVRGTGFVASVSTPPGGETSTTIAGLSGGMIAVWAVIDPSGRIFILPNQFTIIRQGQLPTDPMIITEEMIRDLLEGMIFTGSSIEFRSGELFNSLGMGRSLVFLTPEALQELLQSALGRQITEDDPSKLIFQDPPPFTPIIIKIEEAQ